MLWNRIPTILFAPDVALCNVLLPRQIKLPSNLVTNVSVLHVAEMRNCSIDSCIVHDAP